MPARRQSGIGDDSPVAVIGSANEGRSGRGKEGKEKETFGCPFPGCGQMYSRMEYLKRHQRKHQDDRPFQCKDCTKAFARSDVLLRHRRRCHPTPPPTDRNSHSPPAPHRNYPGVPISSSRTDAREASPSHQRSRKHPRPSSGDDEQAASRSRLDPRIDPSLEDDFEDDDDDRYPEGSRFGRHNGMGNGGVYSAESNFYGSGPSDNPNYTPHLLPMFQQNQQYHSLNDPNHLEDASVLLSMAYPGGVPSGENNDPNKDLPEWASNPTINMMMEAAVAANREQEAAASRNGSVSSNNAAPVDTNGPTLDSATNGEPLQADPPIDPTLAGSEPLVGNFLNTMSWLSGLGSEGVSNSKDVNSSNSNANAWQQLFAGNSSSGPLSPFLISSLFSPSAVGNGSATPTATNNENAPASPTIMNILEQLAMNEMPQTITNPNPERPLLRLESSNMSALAGGEWGDKHSRFYLPAERFAGCYQIPHWALPPLRTLSTMACRTFHTVLNHFSFLHMPTFKLIDTAACLAFAICTVGGIKTNKNVTNSDDLIWTSHTTYGHPQQDTLDGPVVPDQSWENLYHESWEETAGSERAQDAKKVLGWQNGTIVRSEKTNMLVKSFSLAKGVLMTEYNVALLQALILYHAPNFLSGSDSERLTANMYMGTIVNITRQIGFYTPEAEHFETKIATPVQPYTPSDLDRCWRQWISLETRRRTAFLVYQLDTVSALESNIPCILSTCEVSYVPLPAPDTLWKAPTAEAWLKAVKNYRPMTMDEAMRRIFFLPTYGSFDSLHENSDTQYYNLLNQTDMGPFARCAMVITLLRGVMDIGEGKRDRGDWRDLTDLWVGCSWLRPHTKMLAQDGTDLGRITRESLRGRFSLGLQKWREGWDFDSLCSSPLDARKASPRPEERSGDTRSSSESQPSEESLLPKETLNYCEDALPLYWLAQALLTTLNATPPSEPGTNVFSGVRYGDMLKKARTFTRTGEGVAGELSNRSASYARRSPHGTGAQTLHDQSNPASTRAPIPTTATAVSSGSAKSNPTTLATPSTQSSSTPSNGDAAANLPGWDSAEAAELFSSFFAQTEGGVSLVANDPTTEGASRVFSEIDGVPLLGPGVDADTFALNMLGDGAGQAKSGAQPPVHGGGVVGVGDLAEKLGFII
ncbi:hypothetical protein CI109_106772 [Kwoniella shandongensis]|uniref:Uncharacterized protein n=1 Tax=Kwoniella shandongensis TaxID=1734106 RepID=A0A5M6CAJ4_9TREE|nr:uncharacterized protein CI109_000972 [Kwoniella shandongensis]KAA5530792.1 hypothetical protein CI109_000972 [Kwoniella shandongensis]